MENVHFTDVILKRKEHKYLRWNFANWQFKTLHTLVLFKYGACVRYSHFKFFTALDAFFPQFISCI